MVKGRNRKMKEQAIDNKELILALEELEKEGQLFVLYPSDTHGVGRLEQDVVKLESLYKTGYQDLKDHHEDLDRYLQAE